MISSRCSFWGERACVCLSSEIQSLVSGLCLISRTVHECAPCYSPPPLACGACKEIETRIGDSAPLSPQATRVCRPLFCYSRPFVPNLNICASRFLCSRMWSFDKFSLLVRCGASLIAAATSRWSCAFSLLSYPRSQSLL